MSGGTWDYRQHHLRNLGDDMRIDRREPWGDDDEGEPYPLRDARHFMAGVLDVMGTLVKELDWHITGDTHIEDERLWVMRAQQRIMAAFDTWPGRCGDCGATTTRDADPSAVYCAACERSAR